MSWWEDLFKSPAERKADQEKARRESLLHARQAIRAERRAINKMQSETESLRRKAVDYEKQGNSMLAKQLVRQFVQADKQFTVRTMAVNNMEFVLGQAQTKENYEQFLRSMKVVADIEDMAKETMNPDELKMRLTELAQRNTDLLEPWTEMDDLEVSGLTSRVALSPEEEEAYGQVINDAAGQVKSSRLAIDPAFAKMDEELERKMDAALGKE